MARLSKDKAQGHYEKLLAIHNFKYLTLAQKVSIFYHDLEHDILNEITGKKLYYDQFDWLKDNQIKIERNVKKGYIPKVIIDDIDNLKNWRNEGVHENKMPEPKYKSHFHTMAQTICFFSEIPWSDEINNIIINKQNVISKEKKHKGKNNKKLGISESLKLINRKYSLSINRNNSAYSCTLVPQWCLDIDNSKFKNNFYIILEDQEEKYLYCFYLERSTINFPERIFKQRNDEYRNNVSTIRIKKNDKNFFDIVNNKFQFGKYLKAEVKY